VCKESGNLNLEREFLVRGVVFDALDTYTLYYALVIETTCLSPVFLHCSIGFLGFSQKPPGGLILTARRLIRGERMFLFWFESPGGDEFLPGGATLVVFCLMALMLNWENVMNC